MPDFVEPDARDARPTRRSTTPTGSSSPNGTATGSRPSCRRAGAALDAQRQRRRALLPGAAGEADLDRRPARRSSTARWSRSTRDGRPDFGLLQARLGRRPRRARTSPRAATGARGGPGCAARLHGLRPAPWCAGRSLLDVPLEDRKASCDWSSASTRASASAAHVDARRRGVLRGRRRRGPRGRDGQAPAQPLRAGPSLAQPGSSSRSARPGARRRRLRAGPGQPPRPRGAPRRRDGGRPPALRGPGRQRARRRRHARRLRAALDARALRRRRRSRMRPATWHGPWVRHGRRPSS